MLLGPSLAMLTTLNLAPSLTPLGSVLVGWAILWWAINPV